MTNQTRSPRRLRTAGSVAARTLILVAVEALAQGPTDVSFSRYGALLTFSDNYADGLLSGSNVLLSCGDHVSRLTRRQPVASLPGSAGGPNFSGSITNWSQLQDIARQPGNVKVVAEIGICVDASGNPLPGTFAGCVPRNTPVTEPSIVLAYSGEPTSESLALAHEYGHTQGLPHSSEPLALMRAGLSRDNKNLNSAECTKLAGARPPAGGSVAPAGAVQPGNSVQ